MPYARLIAVLTLSGVVAAAMPALAHHSVSSEFDYAKKFSFQATVIKLVAINPHSVLEVERTNPDGTKTVWKLQTLGAGSLRQRFGPEGAVKPGQVVTVEGIQSRSGNPYGFLENLIMPDGRAVKTYFGDPNGN
jgi:hypothetical protein